MDPRQKAMCWLAAASVLGIAGCFWSPLPLLLSPIPTPADTHGNLPIDGPITIRYDRFGIPHIDAQTDRDLYFALGYVHGRDRLAEVSYLRQSATGELASVFGRALVAQDIATRALRLDDRVAASLDRMRPETRANLESYVAGINMWISPFGLPFEFVVAGRPPKPCTIEDVLRVALWTQSELQKDHYDLDTTTRLVLGLGREAAEEFFGRPLPGNLTYLTTAARRAAPPVHRRARQAGGSNNWAVSGSRTATGLPLLANDPHLRITFPSMWYLVVLDTPTRSFRGATMPGVPAFMVGTNGNVGFGITLTNFALTDTYLEVLDEAETRYLVDGVWRDLRFEEYSLPVLGELVPRFIVQPFTHRGPLVDGPAGLRVSRRWHSGDVCRDLEATLELLSASTVEEAMEIVRAIEVSSFNYVFADRHGSIGWQTTGRIPRRRDATCLLPLDGTRAQNDWDSFFSGHDLPGELNPARGYVATANQRPDVAGHELPQGVFASRYRIDRIEELLQDLHAATPADMARIQRDVYSRQFEAYRPAILDAAGVDPTADVVIAQLSTWDGRMSPDSRAAVLFDSLLTELARLLVVDRMPADVELDRESVRILEEFEVDWPGIMTNPASTFWVDPPLDPHLPGPPGRRTALAIALRRGVENAPSGDWGGIHRYDIHHPFAPFFPTLSTWLELAPAPAPGSATTVCMNSGRSGTGVTLRLIADMSEPQRLQVVLPTGQSGRPGSPNSRDQYALWLRGERLTIPSPRAPSDTVIVVSP